MPADDDGGLPGAGMPPSSTVRQRRVFAGVAALRSASASNLDMSVPQSL
ncbi:hypothetical protein [Sinomonas halotolerans]|uniref:Uncharacterized protein n=1 Tax=Sinomonas halotolerans TaxID=1644133 RepID=A0ABU9WVS7_9MICC